jgi:hypothetical protein
MSFHLRLLSILHQENALLPAETQVVCRHQPKFFPGHVKIANNFSKKFLPAAEILDKKTMFSNQAYVTILKQ